MTPFQDRRRRRQIGQLSVGAGAYHNLVNRDVGAVAGVVGVFGEVRIGYRAVHVVEIDIYRAFVYGVGVGLHGVPRTLYAVADVLTGNAVNGEDSVFRAGLNRHIADGEAVVNRQLRHARPGELQGLVTRAVHANHADERQNHVFPGDIRAEFSGQIDLYCGGDFEPRFPGSHRRAHVGGADARRERAQRAVSAGMGIGADDGLSGGD